MKPFSLPSITIAFMLAIFMSLRGRKRRSLTKGGAICAFVVGFLGLTCGLRGFLLLLFYIVSCVYDLKLKWSCTSIMMNYISIWIHHISCLCVVSPCVSPSSHLDSTNHHIINYTKVGTKATKYKMQTKSCLDSAAADSSCRGPHQVLACSVIGVFIQLTHVVYCGEEQSLGGYFLFLYCR